MSGANAQGGVEFTVTLNADGTITGMKGIVEALGGVEKAAKAAGDAIDGTGKKGGAGAGGGPRAAGIGGTSFLETRMGQFTQNVASAGLSFIERNLPNLFDPTKSSLEKRMEAAPLAARSAAQLSSGAALGALETKLAGSGIEIPETLKQQIIHTAGVAAEEGAKAIMRQLKTQVDTARQGAMGQFAPFAQMGIMPDAEAMDASLRAWGAVGKRQFALERAIADRIDHVGFSGDESVQKNLSGPSSLDVAGILDMNKGQGAFGGR